MNGRTRGSAPTDVSLPREHSIIRRRLGCRGRWPRKSGSPGVISQRCPPPACKVCPPATINHPLTKNKKSPSQSRDGLVIKNSGVVLHGATVWNSIPSHHGLISYKSSGLSPVTLAIRANILGPISSRSWKGKTTSGQPGRDKVLCDPFPRLICQPNFFKAANTLLALVARQALMPQQTRY